MPDVYQLNLLDGLDVGTAETDDGDRFDVWTIEAAETWSGYEVRFRDGRGQAGRQITVNLSGKSAAWLADQLRGMVDRFAADHADD
jgi:hypothetical protein